MSNSQRDPSLRLVLGTFTHPMFGDDLDPICANFAGRDPNLFRVLVVKISKGIYCAQNTYNFLGVVLI